MTCATLVSVMASSSRRVSRLAGLTPVFPLSAQAGLPVITVATVPAVEECTCPHGEGQVCPMHHPSAAAKTCAWRSNMPDPAAAALLSFLGALFVTVPPADLVPPVDSARAS